LSHTWGDDEISFQDITSSIENAKSKHGFVKIEYCARQSLKDGYDWCWIDTCCIDKTSSAELTEAINSIYAWYKRSHICFAYLVDVKSQARCRKDLGNEWQATFADSRWFTRSWTLQELIAPQQLHFYGRDWEYLGSRNELLSLISEITKIQEDILVDATPHKASIAQRMCWAATRRATVVEDTAYSLMGLFDINMPLLYGEGMKSFQRLQEEILKSSDDETIFAWIDPSAGAHTYSGLLARSPNCFKRAHDIASGGYERALSSEPFSVTNKGLRIQFACGMHPKELNEAFAELGCIMTHKDDGALFIRVRRLSLKSEQWVRVDPHQIFTQESLRKLGSIRWVKYKMFFRQNIQLYEGYLSNRVAGFRLRYKSLKVKSIWPAEFSFTTDGLIAIQNQSQHIEARVLLCSTITGARALVSLECNGTGMMQAAKMPNSTNEPYVIEPYGFSGALSWVNSNYKDVSVSPALVDCLGPGYWRLQSLDMNLSLVENNLYVEVMISSSMDAHIGVQHVLTLQ
jgi:hypothetical protein